MEPMEPMEPMAPPAEGRVERLSHQQERLAWLRALVTEHAALVHELQDFHTHYLELAQQPMSGAERHAQQAAIVSAELVMVERALDLQRSAHDLLRQSHRLLC
jgi:hypothetical protein